MRAALQATFTGFGDVTAEAVFKVCDQPHPKMVATMLEACARGDLASAYTNMKALCDMGYSAVDIITTVFRVRADQRTAAAARALLRPRPPHAAAPALFYWSNHMAQRNCCCWRRGSARWRKALTRLS